MSRTKYLRLPENHAIPSKVLESIKKTIYPAEIKYYNKELDIKKCHEDRRDSFFEAFEFLINAHPPTNYSSDVSKRQLIGYAQYCRDACDFSGLIKQADMKAQLAVFLQKMLAVLTDVCRWGKAALKFEEARDWLNEAEQYALMQKEHREIATVIPLKVPYVKDTLYVLNWDKHIPFYGEAFLNDLRIIKEFNAPISGPWIKSFSPPLKSYFAKLPENIYTDKDLVKSIQADIKLFSEKWNLLKSEPFLDEKLKYIREGTPQELIPKQFLAMPARFQSLIKYSATKEEIDAHIRKLKEEVNALSNNESAKEELKKTAQLPLWFTVLPEIQQHLLRKVLSDCSSVEEAIKKLPSRARFLPALPNTRGHKTIVCDSEAHILVECEERDSSSHWASRDVPSLGQEISDQHVQNNLETSLNNAKPDQRVFYGTLISPVNIEKVVPGVVYKCVEHALPPDYRLHTDLQRNIKSHPQSQRIVTTNHFLNIGRILNSTSRNSSDIVLLLDIANAEQNKSPELESLLKVYNKLVDTGFGSAYMTDRICRELCFSSLDQILSDMCNIKVTISCVSGKDRAGIVQMHTDAMYIFHAMYGKWPIHVDANAYLSTDESALFINAEERKIFVDIFCSLFLSRHHQEHAGTNAPGAAAIQNGIHYLPQDIKDAIHRRLNNYSALHEESQIATYNELKKIVKSPASANPHLIYEIPAMSCSKEVAQSFIDTLYKYIQQKNQFNVLPNKEDSYRRSLNLFIAPNQEVTTQSPIIETLRRIIGPTGGDSGKHSINPQRILVNIFGAIQNYNGVETNPNAIKLCSLIRSIVSDSSKQHSTEEIIDIMKSAYRESTKTSPRCNDERFTGCPKEPTINCM